MHRTAPAVLSVAVLACGLAACSGGGFGDSSTSRPSSATRSQQVVNTPKASAAVAAFKPCQALTLSDAAALFNGKPDQIDRGSQCLYGNDSSNNTADLLSLTAEVGGTTTAEDSIRAMDSQQASLDTVRAAPEVGDGAYVGWSKTGGQSVWATVEWHSADGTDYRLDRSLLPNPGEKPFDPKEMATDRKSVV